MQPSSQDVSMRSLPPMTVIQAPGGPPRPVVMIVCAKYFEDLLEPIQTILRNHGGSMAIEAYCCSIFFPSGTVKYRMFPTMTSERYQINFPDGYIVHELEAIDNANNEGLSLITFDLKEFPEHLRRKYAH